MSRNHRSKTKLSQRWRHIWRTILVVVVLIMAGSVLTVRHLYTQNLQPLNSSQKSVQVTVPSGATVSDIAQTLHDKGVIRAAWAFDWYVRTNSLRERLQAGTYSLRPSQSVSEVATILTNGAVKTDLVTILPGQRIDQIRSMLINNAGFSEESVDKALDPNMYLDHPALADKPVDASLEGYLYPDSYQKTSTTTPETIVRASLDEMQKRLTPSLRAAIVKQGLTLHEGIVLASIVEQEVSNPADKPTVAQVFLSRLRQHILLGSDVTAFYGAIVADKTPSVTYDSPYNTHYHKGLPPGPISNISEASIRAVANPAHTDYLFFVAGDDGVTYFSRTNEEHEKLTKQHCKTLCS